MLSNKRLLVDRGFTNQGRVLHSADGDQFVTIKMARASTGVHDDAQVLTELDKFRITVGDDLSIWIPYNASTGEFLLEDFPVAKGECLRVTASPNLVNKFLVFGWFEYA